MQSDRADRHHPDPSKYGLSISPELQSYQRAKADNTGSPTLLGDAEFKDALAHRILKR
jgi:hypothetical protein